MLSKFIEFIENNNFVRDKSALCSLVVEEFNLVQDRSVYACKDFAVRFSSASSSNFSNTILSLSNLQKYDDRPFIVCLTTPDKIYLYLANTTFLKKISHSSHELRENNIKGSFNGGDIIKEFNSISNSPENFEKLYNIHAGIDFEDNLVRLVAATNNISPTGKRFEPTLDQIIFILDAPERALEFTKSVECKILKNELDDRVRQFSNEIILAALIENVNIRGRIIEYFIAGEDDLLKKEIIQYLNHKKDRIPEFKTENNLGDYSREFDNFHTETDVKTKIMVLNSNPKAYNIDKILSFLSTEKSIFMFYFVGVSPTEILNTVLVSMFQNRLLQSTILLRHWAGRNSRGVTQFEGGVISELVNNPSDLIEISSAKSFLNGLISL